ncbi:nitrogen regulatory protein P-II [archaeon]|nr:nitrogen regulatory protein P-II [archaeon]
MMRIEAVIRPDKKWKVRDALTEAGYPFTKYGSEGIGSQLGIKEIEGKPYRFEFLEKVTFVCVVKDEEVDRVCDLIAEAAYTGRPGDGKIFISRIEGIRKIRDMKG